MLGISKSCWYFWEVRNIAALENSPPTGYEIVSEPRYDQALVFDDFIFPPPNPQEYMPMQANHKFPPALANCLVEKPWYQVPPENQPPLVSPNESLHKDGFFFPPLHNNVLVEGTSEVQDFQQTSSNALIRKYQRNYRNHEPLTSSIPQNKFLTPLQPNVSNNPSPLRDSPKCQQPTNSQGDRGQSSMMHSSQSEKGTNNLQSSTQREEQK